MYVLDTDTYSNFLRGKVKIVRRILRTPPNDLYLCAITSEELLKGRLAVINDARRRKSASISDAYDYLLEIIIELNKIQIFKYDTAAEKLFQSWPQDYKQSGSQDTRIAAVACVNRFRVVTGNVKHFARIAGLEYEDWSV